MICESVWHFFLDRLIGNSTEIFDEESSLDDLPRFLYSLASMLVQRLIGVAVGRKLKVWLTRCEQTKE